MTVYVDDAFAGDWGKWSGGGHLQADSIDELHAFAVSIGLRRSWFHVRPGRPWNNHYDCTSTKRDAAIFAGAVPESIEDGSARRRRSRTTEQVEG